MISTQSIPPRLLSAVLSPQIAPLSCLLLPKLSTLVDCCLRWVAHSASCWPPIAITLLLSHCCRPIAFVQSPSSKHRSCLHRQCCRRHWRHHHRCCRCRCRRHSHHCLCHCHHRRHRHRQPTLTLSQCRRPITILELPPLSSSTSSLSTAAASSALPSPLPLPLPSPSPLPSLPSPSLPSLSTHIVVVPLLLSNRRRPITVLEFLPLSSLTSSELVAAAASSPLPMSLPLPLPSPPLPSSPSLLTLLHQRCFIIVIVVVLLGSQLEDLDQTIPQRHCPWHADGAPTLGLAVQGPPVLTRGLILSCQKYHGV